MIFTPGWAALIAFVGSVATAGIAISSLWHSHTRFDWERREQRKANEREALIDVVHWAERWAAAVRIYAPVVGTQPNSTSRNSGPFRITVPESDAIAERRNLRGAVTEAGLGLQRAVIKAEVLTADTATLTKLEEMLSLAGTLSYFIGESLPHSDRDQVQGSVRGRAGEICQLADSITDRLRSELGHTDPIARPFKAVEYDF